MISTRKPFFVFRFVVPKVVNCAGVDNIPFFYKTNSPRAANGPKPDNFSQRTSLKREGRGAP
jgi:hypothetical protein